MTALHDKYRPGSWEEMFGQTAAVKQLERICARQSSQTFLLNGPSGTGKTTLARIAAKSLGCEPSAIIEQDGATLTGIDDMRMLKQTIAYRPIASEGVGRAVILDECHRVSANAWDSLLKITEEPPPHLYWFFCTTNPDKIPNTLRTRCTPINLKAVDDNTLADLFDAVCGEEGIQIDGSIRQIIVGQAKGSPRQLLVNLDTCRDAGSRAEALELLQAAGSDENDPGIKLCRLLVRGGATWRQIVPILAELKEASAAPESTRILICNYFAACASKAKSDKEAVFFLDIINNFAQPYGYGDGSAQLLRSIGFCVFPPN